MRNRERRGHKTINGTQFRNEKTHFERQFELSQSIHAYQRASSFRCFSFSHRSLASFFLLDFFLLFPSFQCFALLVVDCCVSLEHKSSFGSSFHEKFVFMLFEIAARRWRPGVWCAFSHKCEHFVARLRSTYVRTALAILCQRATHYSTHGCPSCS